MDDEIIVPENEPRDENGHDVAPDSPDEGDQPESEPRDEVSSVPEDDEPYNKADFEIEPADLVASAGQFSSEELDAKRAAYPWYVVPHVLGL